jgi:hypothetical protein
MAGDLLTAHSEDTYFWTLLAALGVLVAGTVFSLREGIEELIHPSATSRFAVAYVVLAVSTVFDLTSFRQSAGQGIVAVLIGLLLIRFGFRLVQRSHDFLVGAWLLTSPAPQGRADQVTSILRGIRSHRSEYIYRIDVVPIGGAEAVPE